MCRQIAIPQRLRELRRPWFDSSVPPAIENIIRHGGSVVYVRGHPTALFHPNGGAGLKAVPLDKSATAAFFALREKEYAPPAEDCQAASYSWDVLAKSLSRRGVLTIPSSRRINPSVYALTAEVLGVLPESHLGHKHFKILDFSEEDGDGAAKTSEYRDPSVRMFPFAFRGPVRNYVGLLLHEVGHSFVKLMAASDRREIHAALSCVFEEPHQSIRFPTVDFLFGQASRRESMQMDSGELLADVYLYYVVHGGQFESFIRDLPVGQRHAWRTINRIYRKYFAGIEYV